MKGDALHILIGRRPEFWHTDSTLLRRGTKGS